MAGRVEGKVAFITGAARGQGRSHAVRLASEGASIIAVDVCAPIEGIGRPPASEEDLAETVREVEATGGKIVAGRADVRDFAALSKALEHGVNQFGQLDIVSANAGVGAPSFRTSENIAEQDWQTQLDINLTGVWHTTKAAIPHMVAGGRGGSIILTSSVAGLKGHGHNSHYVASKHGVTGLMRGLAVELAPHSIRVNSLHPTQVDTDMIMNDLIFRLFCPDLENPGRDDMAKVSALHHKLPVPWVEPADVTNALLFLASDESRYITGVPLPIDAGALLA